MNTILNAKAPVRRIIFLSLAFFFALSSRQAHADVLSPGIITSCGEIAVSSATPYTLGNDISTSTGPCLIVTAGGAATSTIIDGAGHTITGGIYGDGVNQGDPGFNFTVQNATVVGTISANAADIGDCSAYDLPGAAGGTISIIDSTTTIVTAHGTNNGTSTACNSQFSQAYGGSGGAVSIASSTFSSISVDGGYINSISDGFSGGYGGSISISGSDASLAGAALSLNGGSGQSNGITGYNGSLQIHFTTFNYASYVYPALSALALYGPNDLPGQFNFSNNDFAGGTPLFASGVTDCSIPLIAPGIYTLAGDVGSNKFRMGCLINSNGVTIDGMGYTIYGNVDGDYYNTAGTSSSFTLENVTVLGTTSSRGVSDAGYTGITGSAGTITILNATTSAVVTGGYDSATGKNDLHYDGQSGGVIMSSSTASYILVGGGFGGVITIDNSNVGPVSALGTGQQITIVNSTTTAVSADYSLLGLFVSCGLCSVQSGPAGAIDITNSVTGNITANSFSGTDSAGGDIVISGPNLNLPNMTIFATGKTKGTLALHYTNQLNAQGLILSALRDLIVDGPGNLPGDLGAFGGGAFSLNHNISDASQCNLNIASTTYVLADNIVGNCAITANNVTLDGQGHSITGNVTGDGITGNNGNTFTLSNVTVTGNITSNGSNYSNNPIIGGIAGSGGSITIKNSTTTNIYANPVMVCAPNSSCGSGGSVTVQNSITGNINTDGGSAGSHTARNGGNGGSISIATSTTGSLSSKGGNSSTRGGNGGNINATSSFERVASSTIDVSGGNVVGLLNGPTPCGYGGSAGSVNLKSSIYTGAIIVNPGNDQLAIGDGLCSVTYPPSGSSGSRGYVSISNTQAPSQTEVVTPSTPPTTNPTNPTTSAPSSPSSSSASGSFVGNPPVASTTPATPTPTVAPVVVPPTTPKSPYQSIVQTAARVIQQVGDTAAAVANSPSVRPVQTVGFFAGLVASIGAYAEAGVAAPLASSEIFLIPLRLWSLILAGLGIKRRGRPWGTVYDSVTKQPIDPAYITVKDANGKVVAESITDLDGRFGFLLPDGTYYVSVRKTNYSFPSVKLAGKASDELYSDLYFGEPVTVRAGEVLDKNIPLDQEHFDWNEQYKKDTGNMLFHSKNERIWATASKYLYGVGLTVSVIVVMVKPSIYNIAFLLVYVAILAFLEFGTKKRQLGTIVTQDSGEPLSYALIRIMTPDRMVTLRSTVADAQGRYYCIVPDGAHVVEIKKKNQDGSYGVVYESPITSSAGIINKNFVV